MVYFYIALYVPRWARKDGRFQHRNGIRRVQLTCSDDDENAGRSFASAGRLLFVQHKSLDFPPGLRGQSTICGLQRQPGYAVESIEARMPQIRVALYFNERKPYNERVKEIQTSGFMRRGVDADFYF
jgi:hypothetical protein